MKTLATFADLPFAHFIRSVIVDAMRYRNETAKSAFTDLVPVTLIFHGSRTAVLIPAGADRLHVIAIEVMMRQFFTSSLEHSQPVLNRSQLAFLFAFICHKMVSVSMFC